MANTPEAEARRSRRLDATDEKSGLVLEVKNRLSSARGLRDALAQLAGDLAEAPATRAVLLLVNPRISRSRISAERRRLMAALRPGIAKRLDIVVWHDGRFEEKPEHLGPKLCKRLVEAASREAGTGPTLRRADLQSEVFRVLVLRWANSGGPVTSRWLQDTVGCNYRTVAAALERLGKALERHRDRRVELDYFPREPWARLLANSDSTRSTRRYTQRSGTPRSPESLSLRLRTLEREDLAVGGVIGARHHHPDLDLIGTPRLDVSVHAPDDRADLSFVRRLDPALDETREADAPPRLVLHFLRRKEALFDEDEKGRLWADPVECLLDLQEARLEAQALAFFEHLVARRETPDPA